MTFAPDSTLRCAPVCKSAPDLRRPRRGSPPEHLLPLVILACGLSLPFFPVTAQTPAITGGGSNDSPQSRISAQVYADKAFENFYSAEFFDSAENYRKAIELERSDPAFWTGLADSYLFQMLLAAGRLDSNQYTAGNEFAGAETYVPDAKLVNAMWDAIKAARNVCDERIKRNPRDARAQYSLAVTYGAESNFHLNIARKGLEALTAAGKARDHAKLAITYDPQLHDANFFLGAYEYSIGSVPLAFRWMLALGGHSGTKARGVELIQDALQHGQRTGPPALALLGVIYTREREYAYSRMMWQHLMRFYPRSYIYELEVARTYMNEANLGAALEAYKSIERKMEGDAPGYAGVKADKLYFQIATLLESKARTGEALAYYAKVVSGNDTTTDLLEARAYLRMGDIYRSLNQKEKARGMYEKARGSSAAEIKREANARLRTVR